MLAEKIEYLSKILVSKFGIEFRPDIKKRKRGI